MANGINALASLQGKVDANGALVVALEGPMDIGAEDLTTTGTVDAGAFAVGGVAGYTGVLNLLSSDGTTPVAITVTSGLITNVA